MSTNQILNIFAILCGFAGTYLSLRSIFVGKVARKLQEKNLEYIMWDQMSRYYKFIFRLFGVNSERAFLFNQVEFQLSKEDLELKRKLLYDFWEPFRAIVWFAISFGLLILVQFIKSSPVL